MFYIETERLRLIPLTHDLLKLYWHDRLTMEQQLGLVPSAMDIDPEYRNEVLDALENFWLPKTAAHADAYRWYTNWEIVLKQSNMAIGGIGFAGYPDDQGEAEVGFMLDRQFQKNGYAREALEAMVQWAFADRHTVAVVARTPVDNVASRSLLIRAGFGVVADDGAIIRLRRARE